MNIFLKFRSPTHDKAYAQDFVLQFRKRCRMCLLNFVFYMISFLIVTLTDRGSGNIAPKISYAFRLSGFLTVIIIAYCLERRWKKPKKYMHIVNAFLDVLIFLVMFTYYPLITGVSISVFGEVGVFFLQFSNGYLVANSLSLLGNWWIRVFAIIAQYVFFIVFILLREEIIAPLIATQLFNVIICSCWVYLNEKYERLNFLEKRKDYENFEALKKIFDDVSQGIAIIDRIDYSNFYQNHSVNEIFDSEVSIDWKRLFPQIKVRKINPNIELGCKSRISLISERRS